MRFHAVFLILRYEFEGLVFDGGLYMEGLFLGILQYTSGTTPQIRICERGKSSCCTYGTQFRSESSFAKQRHEINKFTVPTKQEIVRFQYFSDAASIGQFTAYVASIVVYGQVGKSCKFVTTAQMLNFK